MNGRFMVVIKIGRRSILEVLTASKILGTAILFLLANIAIGEEVNLSSVSGNTLTEVNTVSANLFTKSEYKAGEFIPIGSFASVPAPAPAIVCVGDGASFTAPVSALFPVSYQWYNSTNGGGSWNLMPGETNQILNLPPVTLSMNGYLYRCTVDGTPSSVELLTVNPLPVPTITGLSASCAGTSGITYTTEAGMTGYQWSVPSGGTITAGGTTNQITVTWNASGAHTVEVNYSNANGCTAPAATAKSVTVNALPTPTITGLSTSCAGAAGVTYTTESGMGNYNWTISAGGTITSGGGSGNNSVTVTWNIAGIQRVGVNYTNSNNCAASTASALNVTVNPRPLPTISGLANLCAGTSGVTYATEAGMTGYSWTVSPGGTITAGSTTNTISVTWNNAGAQSVSVNYVNSNGCTASAATAYPVTVNPVNTPSITGLATTCEGSTGIAYTTEAGMTGYAWTVSAGGTITSGSTSNQIAVTWTGTGAQTVSASYVNPFGCMVAVPTAKNVTVNPLPVPTILGLSNVCAGTTGVTYTTEAGMSGYAWTVSSGGTITSGGTSGSNTVTVTWSTAGAQTVSVNYTNANNCLAAAPTTKNVTVNALPVPTITGLASSCAGSTGITYTTESGMSGYNWTVSPGGTITSGAATNQIAVTWNSAGTQSVSVNYTNGNSCAAAVATTQNVTVSALLTPTITGQATSCAGIAGVTYTTEAGMTGYNWTVSAGGTITAGSTSNQISVTWNTAGAQTVRVNYTNANGCSTTPALMNVTVNPLPAPVIAGLATLCQNSTGVTYTTEAGMSSYNWTISSGGTITSGVGSSSVVVDWNGLGAQSLSVNYTNANGCSAQNATIKNITINPLPVPTITGSATPCIGSTGIVYTTEAGMIGYNWNISAGGIITSGSSSNTINVTWTTAGPQSVTVNYTNTNGCSAPTATTYNIVVNALSVPTINGLATPCVGSTGVTYSTQPGMSNYVWNVSAGGTVTSGGGLGNNSVTVTWNSTGANTVSVNYDNSNGCAASSPTIMDIAVSTLPVPTITGPIAACIGQNTYTTEAGMTGYTWIVPSGGTITSGSTTNQVVVNWNAAGPRTISVNYANSNGCSATTSTMLNVTVNTLPTPTIAGSVSTCAGTTGVTYTTQPGMSNYIWSVSAGGTITSGGGTGNNTVTVTWNSAGAQAVAVNYTNSNGCTALTQTIRNVTVNSLPVATISGLASPCAGPAGVTYFTQAGMTGYTWSVSSGGSIVGGGGASDNTISIAWNALGNQTINVSYTDPSGCTAATAQYPIQVVNSVPAAPPSISGNSSVCQGAAGVAYSISPVAGASSYTWLVTNGVIATNSGTSITVNFDPFAVSGNVSVYATNGCGDGPTVSKAISFSAFPLPFPTITGPASACVASSGEIYTTEPGMNNYSWTVTGGGIITAGSTTNQVTVVWNTAGAKTVQVNYVDVNGCNATVATSKSVTVNALPLPTITGAVSLCAGSTGIVYTTEAAMTGYTWAVSSGGVITSGGTTNQIQVTWNTPGAQTVTVNYTNANGCTAASPATRSVTVNPLPVPTITGLSTTCAGTTGISYSTEPGMTGYSWNVSAGGTITSGSSSNSIVVSWTTPGAKTVSVNYFTLNGCTAPVSTVKNVTVNAQPVPTIAGLSSACEGSTGVTYTTEPGMSGYNWSLSPGGSITTGNTSNQITVTWATAGARSVSVNYIDPNSCSATFATVKNISVYALPVPTIAGPLAACEGTAGLVYTTEPGMSGYTWTVSSGGTITSGSNSNVIQVTWNGTGAQTVTVNYANSFGCTAPVAKTINVNIDPLPVPTIAGLDAVCAGTTGVTYTTEPGMTNYIWTISPGGTVTSGGGVGNNLVTVSWLTAGAQSVTVNYDNGFGCDAPSATTKNVTVNALPVPAITGPASVCLDGLGITYSTEPGMTTYSWNVSAGGTITSGGTAADNTVTIIWNTAGVKTVGVNYINANGCSTPTATTKTITVNPLAVPTIIGAASTCIGSSGVTYTTQAGMSGYTWTISAGGTITAGSTTNQVTVDWNSEGAQSLSVNYTNLNSCQAAAATTYNVTVNPLPVPTISGPATSCAATTGVVYTTEPGMTGYTWTISPGGLITAGGGLGSNTVTVTWNASGNQTVSVNYTNANGCTATAATSRTIAVATPPLPTITGPAAQCIGTTGAVYSTEAGMTGYNWTISAGGTITSGAGSDQITVNWNTSGAQTVSVNYADAGGCSATIPAALGVLVNPLPVPTITGLAAACAGSFGVTYTTEAGMTGYNWNISAGGTITAGSATNAVTVTWNTAGPQTVSVGYTNANGCTTASATVKNITVNALPVPTIAGNAAPCVGSSGITYATEAGMSSYNWSVTGGTITAGAGTSIITVTWNSAGAQNVSVNYLNASGCGATAAAIHNVTVAALPVPTITGNLSPCIGSAGNIFSTEAGMSGYAWTISAGGVITAGAGTKDITVTWSGSGPQTVGVTYNNASGCAAAAPTIQNITVNTLPAPTITGQATVCAGTTGISYSTEAGMTGYNWTVSAGGTITAGAGTNQITVTWGAAGAQTVSVNYNNANGCSALAATVKPVTVSTAVPTIAGNSAPCIGAIAVTYTTEPGMSGYSWTVSSGGTITSGLGNNVITVNWIGSGAQSVSVNYTAVNGCSAVIPTAFPVLVSALPTPVINGQSIVCEGATGKIYTTAAGKTGYNWSVTGGSITSGGSVTDNTVTVTWNTPGAQSVSVNYTDVTGCNAVTPTVKPVTVNALPIPTITGSSTVCAGTAGVTYSTESGMTAYNWSVSAGGTITSGSGTNQITVTWNSAGARSVSANYITPAGCTATAATTKNVTVTALPVPTVTGTTPVCIGTAGVTYTTQTGMTGYNWSVSPGGTITSGGSTNTITVLWSTAGAKVVSVNYSDANGCSASAPGTLPVVVNSLPVPVITGQSPVCVGTTGVIYSTAAGMSGYSWSISPGGTITSGGTVTDPTVTVTWNATGNQTVSVNYTNANGCTALGATVKAVSVTSPPSPTITGLATACVGTSGVTYRTETGKNGYLWTVSAGGTITSGSGTNQIVVTWNTTGAQTVNVNYTDAGGCTATIPTTQSVLVTPPPVPTITGQATSCAETPGITYTTEPGMTGYTWSTSTGGTITAGTGTNQVTITWNTPGAQSVSVNYVNTNGCTATIATVKNVTVNALPVPTISGAATACAGATGVSYTTEAGMSGYTWSVSGGTITSGSTTNAITVTWNTAGARTVSVNYINVNGCTASNATVKAVAVTGLPVPTISGSLTPCEGATGVKYTTEAGMSAYSWSISSGGVVTLGGTAADNSVTISWPTAGAQSVSVSYTNANGCTAASPTVRAITVNPLPATPSITITGGSANFCSGGSVTLSAPAGYSSYLWSNGATTQSIVVSTAGSFTVAVRDANSCQSAASAPVTTVVLPSATANAGSDATICAGDNFTIAGAAVTNQSAFIWNTSGTGTFINGTTLTPTYVPSVLDQTNGVVTLSLSAFSVVPCTATVSDDITLTIRSLPTVGAGVDKSVCYPSSILVTGTAANYQNPVWSHDGTGTLTGINTLAPTYHPGAADVGNTVKLTLSVDAQNPCATTITDFMLLQVGAVPGNPGIISGPAGSRCKGTTATYSIAPLTGTTNYVWSLPTGITILSGSGTNTINVSFGANAVSGNISVYGSNSCGNGAVSTLLVNVADVPANPGSIGGSTAVCQGTPGEVFTVTPVVGATGYTWTVPSGATITSVPPLTNSITVDFGMAAMDGNVTVFASNGCGNGPLSSKAVKVNIKPATPVITASGNTTTFCEGGNILLSGPTNGFNYLWSPGGATSQTSVVTTSGNYSVVVTDPVTGCSSAASNTIAITVNPAPAAPASTGFITQCWNNVGPAPLLNASTVTTAPVGTTITWYDAPVAGNVVVLPTLNAVGTVTYYAEATNSVTGCKSLNRTPVVLTISNNPAAPVAGASITACEQSPAQTLTATATSAAGTTILWYTTPAGGLPVSPTLSIPGTRTFYAEASNGFCSSLTRSAGVTLTIQAAPAAPVSGGDITRCLDTPAVVYNPTATAPAGSTVVWYDFPTGGTPVAIPSHSALGSRTFYAESKNSTTLCTSLVRTPVTINIISHPAAPIGVNATECEKNPLQTLTASAIVPPGSTVKWYTTASGGLPLATTPTLHAIGTVTYYAATDNGVCESLTRTAVTMLINPAPPAPVSLGDKTICETTPPTTLVAADQIGAQGIGIALKWYMSPSGGTEIANATLGNIGTITYYAEAYAVATTCASLTRSAPVKLTINDTPDQPVTTLPIEEACQTSGGLTLTPTATATGGATVRWYTAATGGTLVNTPSLSAPGTVTYWAEALLGNCTSPTPRTTSVRLTINPAPAPPSVTNPQPKCEDGNPINVSASVPSGIEVIWFATATGGSPVSPTPSLTSAGKITYYAEARNTTTDCRSLTRTAQTLEIKAAPADPVADPNITVCATSPVQTITASAISPDGSPIKWYRTATGGAPVTPSLNVIGTATFYAEADNGSCKSKNRSAQTLTISPVPLAPKSKPELKLCADDPRVASDNFNTMVIPAGSAGIEWFSTSTGGEPLDHVPAFSELVPGTTVYYAGSIDNVAGCQSLTRTAATVTINPQAADPVSAGDVIDCVQKPVQVLRASVVPPTDGSTISWYTVPTGGTAIKSPILNHIGSISYWAESSLGSCVNNNRVQVTLTMTDIPLPPAISSLGNHLTACQSAAGLDANGAIVVAPLTTVKWYDAATNGVEVSPIQKTPGDRILFAEASYTATGCVSATRTKVTLTVKPNPADLTGIDLTECANTTIQTLTATVATPPSGVTYTWYDDPTLGTAVASPTWNQIGSISYYASAQLGGCTSLNRTKVTLTLNARPSTPSSNGDILACEGTLPLNANSAINNPDPDIAIRWFDQPVNGFEIASPVLTFVGTKTFYAEARNLAGCPSPARTAVVMTAIKTPPTPIKKGDIKTCEISSGQTLDANAAITPTPGWTPLWYDDLGAVVASPTLSQVGTVTYYAVYQEPSSIHCESPKVPVTLSINSAPVAVAYTNSPLTLGSSLTLNGGPKGTDYTYKWTSPGGLNYTPANGNVTIPSVIASDAGTYRLIVTSVSTGCSDTITTQVVIYTATAAYQQVCAGGTLVLTGWPDNMKAYEWSGPDGFASTQQNPYIDNVAARNEGVYTLIVTDNKGTQSTGTVNVTINPLPDVFANANTPVCQTGNLMLTGGADDMLSYSWSGPNGYNSILQNPLPVNPAVPGNYILTVVERVNHCAASDTIVVEILKPKASYETLCLGNTLRLRAEPNGMQSYRWTGPAGFTSNLQFPTLQNITSANMGDYTLSVTDQTGCTPPSVVTKVALSNPPNAVITMSPNFNPVCEGTNVTLYGGPTGTTETYLYEWKGPNGFSSTLQNPPVISNIRTADAGLYSLKVTNAAGCSSYTELTLNVIGLTFNGVYGPYCLNDTKVLLSVNPQGVQFSGNGVTGNITSGYYFDPAVAGLGTHAIRYTYSTGSCSISNTFDINVIDDPVVVTNPVVLPGCTGVTADLTLPGVTSGSTGGLIYTYWLNAQMTSAVPTPTAVGSGLYYIKGATASGKCWDVQPVSVGQPDSLRATISASPELNCQGDSTGILTANITMGTAPFSYQWSTNPVQTTQSATNLKAGIYTVIITDAKMCSAAFTGEITEPAPIKLSFNVKNIQCLSDANGSARVDSINGSADLRLLNSYKYLWGTTPVQTTREAVRLTAWWHKVTLTSDKACIHKDSIFIDVKDTIVPSITAPKNIETTLQYVKSTDGSPNKYVIDIGKPFATDNCAIDTITNDAPAKFRPGLTEVIWTVYDQMGLSDTSVQKIFIKEIPLVPQLISPNGDLVNDKFIIDGLDQFPNTQLLIFTRAGQLVFRNDNYELPDNAWDGRYSEASFSKNQLVAPGVYYYILKLGGPGSQTLKGYIYVYY